MKGDEHREVPGPSSFSSAEDAARKFRALLQYANDLVYSVSIDPDAGTWRLEFLSDRVFDFSGYRPEQFVQGGPVGTGGPFGLAQPDEHPFELLHPDDLAYAARQTRLLSQGQAVVREYRLRHRETGQYRWVEDRSRPELDGRGRVVGIWGIVRDIDDRRRIEQDLLQVQKMEAVGRIAGGIAHDFNNILTVILGLTETMIEDVRGTDDPLGLREDLEEVRREAGRAAALTQQLLAFGRKQLMQPRIMSLREAVDEMRSMLERLTGENVDLRIQSAESSQVWADPTQVQQILMNLAINARDAMPSGGHLAITTEDAEIDVENDDGSGEVRAGSFVMLTVSDTGIGMDADTMAQAFDPFFTTRPEGTGLGLSTVYGIVKQSGGHVTVRSEPNQGTTVTVYLPRADLANGEA